MTNDDTPSARVEGLNFINQPYGFVVDHGDGRVTIYGGDFRSNRVGPRYICLKLNPAKPLTGLALRLLAISNAWRHER